ncbi:hypothetical protein DI09_113p60 [Mitosporidium daphniae]|uniref:Insulin-degrading enzyme n=1 Tax=Mitosporidium daphniae TaxID=1485682 RepID=A0A098VVW5_9MICR|nr:uncharacterized protein DI09_113p60 [Mitosporidium daphniae]KGG53065.1 hypothetical protein DI09_113p60 [Mitosporidium daphniae]|eukprot:XP_013239501.1 uncharacterized protein DI09_113p60 [Mitosporidium daphniae]
MEVGNPLLNVTVLPDPIKGKSDKRKYRQLRLHNEIEVIIIHDPLTDTASASLDVAVGSFMDPPHRPGLAHFLEHLLFMGTEKFPDEAEYQTFLSEHGGYSNAYTDDEHTNYFFDVAWPFLEPALDRFAQFFVAPLFSASCTARERDAVHSEHQKNISDDEWRREQLLRTLADKSHPFHGFGTGNAETLSGESVRDEIISFYYTHYRPARMRLAVLGRQPLEILSGWVVELFSAIGARNGVASETLLSVSELNLPIAATPSSVSKESSIDCAKSTPSSCTSIQCPGPALPILGEARLTRMLCIKPLRRLELHWTARDVRLVWQHRPLDLLAEWVGDERPGSLLSYLKSARLASSLEVGVQEFVGFSTFHVSFEITQKGLKQWKTIAQLFFYWLRFVLGKMDVPKPVGRSSNDGDFGLFSENCCTKPLDGFDSQSDRDTSPLFAMRWAELSAVRAQEFDFLDRIHPTSMVYELTVAMHRYPPAERLRGHAGWMWAMPSQALLCELAEQDLTPARCHIMLLTGDECLHEEGEVCLNSDENPHLALSDGFSTNAESDMDEQEERSDIESEQEERNNEGSEQAVESVMRECLTQFPEVEPWYGTRYATCLLEAKDIEMLQSMHGCLPVPAFRLPERNPFIATASELEVVADGETSPLPKEIAPGLWFKRDDRFGLPKGILFLFLRQSQQGQSSEERFAELLLRGSLLQDLLAEELYDASLAGLEFEFRRSGASVASSKAISTGLVVQISGFSPHLLEMAKRIATRCCEDPATFNSRASEIAITKSMSLGEGECRFSTERERLQRRLQGESKEASFKQASALLSLLLTPTHPGPDAVLRVIEAMDERKIRFNPFDTFASLIHGNFTETQALELHRSLLDLVVGTTTDAHRPSRDSISTLSALHAPIRQLPEGRPVLLVRSGVPGPNCCVHLGAIKAEKIALRNYATALLLAQIMAEPFSDQLRTKEQLGYLVRAQPRLDGNVHGIELVVQSNVKGAAFLARRILEFVNVELLAILKAMRSEDMERHGQALIHRLREEPTTLLSEALPYWASIWRGDQLFTLAEETSHQVSELASERNSVLKFFKEHMVEPALRRIALVVVEPEESRDQEDTHVRDLVNLGLLQDPIVVSIGAEETVSMHDSYCSALGRPDAFFSS